MDNGKGTGPDEKILVVGGNPANDEPSIGVRLREDGLEVGALVPTGDRPLVEGRELVAIRATDEVGEDGLGLYDMKTLMEPTAATDRARSGPALVSNDAFRRGWEATFGRRGEPN